MEKKNQSHAVTLTLIGQWPMSKSSEIFSNTTTSSSFKWIEPLFFELSCTQIHGQMETQTKDGHTDGNEYSITNHNYNKIKNETYPEPQSASHEEFEVDIGAEIFWVVVKSLRQGGDEALAEVVDLVVEEVVGAVTFEVTAVTFEVTVTESTALIESVVENSIINTEII